MIGYQEYCRFQTLREAKDYVMAEKGMTDRQAQKYLSEKVPQESYYQRKIMEWLKEHTKGKAVFWKATQGAYSKCGIPDICVIIGGRFYGLEVKRPFFGVVSENQKKVKREIEAIGGKVYIVTYVKEVEEILLPILERSKAE